MRLSISFTIAFLALSLSVAQAYASVESRHELAAWLSQQFHQPLDESQVLSAPDGLSPDSCIITRRRTVATGDTALVLRCPARPLPQLVLLRLAHNITRDVSPNASTPTIVLPRHVLPPLVRAGTALHAYWRTPALHAQLPVVALDSGADGAEIRVRVSHSSRILRARILNAYNVAIVSAGA